MSNALENDGTLSCVTVMPIIENKIAGMAVSAEEQQIVDVHLQDCSKCRDFMGWMGDLEQLAQEVSETQTSVTVARTMDQFYGKQRRRKLVLGGSVVAALAASFLLFFFIDCSPASNRSSSSPHCAASAPREIGAGVWMTYCGEMAPESFTNATGSLIVKLENGTVGISANPHRPVRNRIEVQTRFGAAVVLGTVFTVQQNDTDARLEVYRGKVEVQRPGDGGRQTVVTEGNGVWFRKTEKFTLQVTRPNPLLSALERVDERPGGTAPSGAAGASASAADDSFEIKNSGQEAKRGSSRTFSHSVFRNNQNAAKDRRAEIDSLVQEARNCLIDQNWRCAESRYRTIHTQYNDEWESVSALISLAKIELRHVGKPKEALKHFKYYRKRYPRGPLIEEAIFGMAEAYRKLGNTAMELKTLEKFVEQHPRSSSIAKAQKRISEIGRQ